MPYPEELIRRIADRHDLGGDLRLMPAGGMVNEAWAIGDDHVLRIVMEGGDPECDTEAAREASVVPLALLAGLTTPRLTAADFEFAPRPYTIYEMARGELLGFTEHSFERFEPAYRQIGRELFALHSIAVNEDLRPKLRTDDAPDIPTAVAKTLKVGAITIEDAGEIVATMERLEEIGGSSPVPSLIHNDIHPWNLMGDTSTGGLTAILDWGDATLGDPARDFAAMPLPCVPAMLEGYADAGGRADRSVIARSIVVGMIVALGEVRNPDMPGFNRGWWRMPPGGWPEMKCLVGCHWPDLGSRQD